MTSNGHERATPLRAGDPEELGEYRLVGRLGRGGMGTVHLGTDTSERRVAIKLIHPDLSDDEDEPTNTLQATCGSDGEETVTIRAWVNESLVLEAVDEDPLPGSGTGLTVQRDGDGSGRRCPDPLRQLPPHRDRQRGIG